METYRLQQTVLSIRPRPEVDGTLPNIIKEGACLTTTWKDLDLPKLDSDPFCLDPLLTGTNLDSLFEERIVKIWVLKRYRKRI